MFHSSHFCYFQILYLAFVFLISVHFSLVRMHQALYRSHCFHHFHFSGTSFQYIQTLFTSSTSRHKFRSCSDSPDSIRYKYKMDLEANTDQSTPESIRRIQEENERQRMANLAAIEQQRNLMGPSQNASPGSGGQEGRRSEDSSTHQDD